MATSSKQIEEVMDGMAFWIRRWYNNPFAYVIECLGEEPTHQQMEILIKLPIYGFIAARSGHGIGKTKLMAWLTHWWLDTHKIPGTACRIPCTGASEDALKNNLWSEIAVVNEHKPEFFRKRYFVGNEIVYNKEDKQAWYAVIRVARPDNPDALQGFHNCLFMIDEGSGVADAIFEVARGAMGDEGSMGVMFGNPTRTAGYFFNAFHNSKFWHRLHFSSAESLAHETYHYPFVDALGNIQIFSTKGRQTQKWIDDMRDEFGENSNVYKVRVLGEFADTAVMNVVIEESWLENVFMIPEREVMRKRPLVMGVDVAREGKDNTAIVIRQGTEVVFCTSWNGNDLFISRKKVELIQKEWGCEKMFIDIIGIGSGLHDELRAAGYPVEEVNVTKDAPDIKECKQLRHYLWWQSRKFFRQHKVRFAMNNPDFQELRKELKVVSYTINPKTGLVEVESKDALKARGYSSPNYADAFNMTMLYDADIADVTVMTQKGNDTIQKYLQKIQGADCWAVA